MTTKVTALTDLNFETLPIFKTGKVRSVFDFGDKLLWLRDAQDMMERTQ